MGTERMNGTAENAPIMIEYEIVCGKSPPETRIVRVAEEVCNYCRLYRPGERFTNEERKS
jgi:hypothetical protein